MFLKMVISMLPRGFCVGGGGQPLDDRRDIEDESQMQADWWSEFELSESRVEDEHSSADARHCARRLTTSQEVAIRCRF